MNTTKRLMLGLGSVAAVLALGGLALFSGIGATRTAELVYMTDGPTFNDITDLTTASQAVAHVRVVGASTSHIIPFDPAVPRLAPARPAGGPKATAPQQTASIPTVPQSETGLLQTDFTVEVLDAVRGSGIHTGDRLVVTQLGGKAPDGSARATTENDPLLQVGDQEVLFLKHDAASGKFFTTGGGQGRFKVQANGTLSAVDHDSAIARIATGKPVSFLKNAVQAVR
jgi:hypothetical protein